jgi:hypothetical protein
MSKTAREAAIELITNMDVKFSVDVIENPRLTAARCAVETLEESGFVIVPKARGWDDLEREKTISALRELCAAFGDNDWPNDLHLADVIEKHLGKHLHVAVPEPKP